MSTFKVLITAQQLGPQAQQMLRDAGGELIFMEDPINEATLTERLSVGDIDAVVLRGSKPFTKNVLSSAKNLKIIAKHGAGIDSVDLDEANRSGITIAVAAGANAYAVAEHSAAMMVAMVRGLHLLDKNVRKGKWESTSWNGRDFRGSVVGLVGYGSIGRHTAQLATAFGARVIVLSRTPSKVDGYETVSSLEELLPQVDVLSLHCPLTEQTRGLIGKKELAQLKKGAIVINTARGAVIDEAALIESLESGHLGGAGLDTFEVEPIAPDNKLLKMENVILTSHVAGMTQQAVAMVGTLTAQNIIDTLAKKPLATGNYIAGPKFG